MIKALKQMLGSKKFLAAVVGLIVGFAAKKGLDLDTESLMAILSPILAYILGQGVADMGKEKVKAEA